MLAGPTSAGVAGDRNTAAELLRDIRTECSFMRARLRTVFRALDHVDVAHGVRRGDALSDRMLTDTVGALRAGRVPDRAYQRTSDRIDRSMAAVVVLDESGSMGYGGPVRLTEAVKGVLSIVDPLDALGCPVEAIGFRDGPSIRYTTDGGNYHRTDAVCIDVFKRFEERLSAAKHRFPAARAVGGTPMADGVHYGLLALGGRREAHRLLFVVTDGEANHKHGPVIRRQVRLARESGVHIVGVGIGDDARHVVTTFDDHVFVKSVSDLPSAMIRKLNEIIDTRRVKVAGRIRKIAAA